MKGTLSEQECELRIHNELPNNINRPARRKIDKLLMELFDNNQSKVNYWLQTYNPDICCVPLDMISNDFDGLRCAHLLIFVKNMFDKGKISTVILERK